LKPASLQALIPRITRRRPQRPEPGSVPGTLALPPELPPPAIECFAYDERACDRAALDVAALAGRIEAREAGRKLWVDVQGIGDADAIRSIGAALGLHPLTLEDVVHVHQRAKIEEFDDYLYVVLRTFRLREGTVEHEQISFVLKDDLLVTFQERPGDGFEPVRARLLEGKGVVRHRGIDYLLYALLDVAIDNYFSVVEMFGDSMDGLEEEIRTDAAPAAATAVHTLRRDLRLLRRSIAPIRDLTVKLSRDGVARIDDALRPALRDCFDHAAQAVDLVEGSRERAADLSNLYQSMVSEKTNQTMKILTIIATIFIPLTFLCGVYGMNFDPQASPYNMPELSWRYGYPTLWGVMVATVLGMLWFFRRQGWLGGGR
jgi:magnesium transporter